MGRAPRRENGLPRLEPAVSGSLRRGATPLICMILRPSVPSALRATSCSCLGASQPTAAHPQRAVAAAAACPRAVASETMGRTKQKPKAHAKIKKYKRSRDTKRRDRDVDQVFDDIKRAEALGPQVIPFDDDLPGGGQFYCARPAASDAPLPARPRDGRARRSRRASTSRTRRASTTTRSRAPTSAASRSSRRTRSTRRRRRRSPRACPSRSSRRCATSARPRARRRRRRDQRPWRRRVP